jgi:hypothetical protein
MDRSSAIESEKSSIGVGRVYSLCGVLLLTFLLIDLATPLGIAVGVLYIVPILLSMWTHTKTVTWILAIAASVLILIGYLASPPGPSVWQAVSNRTLSLLAVWVTVLLVVQRRAIDEKREEAFLAKERALDEIRVLRGIMPICSSCKKIRDDDGYWRRVEVYIRDHSEAEFSHSVCPECAVKLYPEFYGGEAELESSSAPKSVADSSDDPTWRGIAGLRK